MAINTGVNASKVLAYAALAPPPGVGSTKVLAYAALAPLAGVNASKALAYAALAYNNANPPVWPSFTFAGGVVGLAYSQTWDLYPAAPPTTYAVVAGSLPPGLTVSNGGADLGTVSGTPTSAGGYSFTLEATNAYGVADKGFTLNVTAASSGGSWTWVM